MIDRDLQRGHRLERGAHNISEGEIDLVSTPTFMNIIGK